LRSIDNDTERDIFLNGPSIGDPASNALFV
jgi:hypothetical protein